MTWVHWVLYNLPPTANGLPERVKTLPEGTREGVNDWKRTVMEVVPADRAPPVRISSMRWILHARPEAAGKEQVWREAMKGHILSEAQHRRTRRVDEFSRDRTQCSHPAAARLQAGHEIHREEVMRRACQMMLLAALLFPTAGMAADFAQQSHREDKGDHRS